MKARLYHDTRKGNSESYDSWSLYFPYSKRMREEYNIYGTYIMCKPTEDGMIKCGWDVDEYDYRGVRPYLGKRVDIRSTPKAFREIVKNLQKLWDDVVQYGTREAWRKFHLA